MKKILIIFVLLLFPINVYAEELTIECKDTKLKNNNETECSIKTKDLSYNATNVTAAVTVSDNLKITYSNYDNTIWKNLDSTFSVSSINLMSENKHNGNNFTIATFKVKAVNQEESNGIISISDIEIGDDNYEGHVFKTVTKNIELTYEKKNVDDNPQTSDLKIILPLILTALLLAFSINRYKKTKVNE